MRQAGTIENHQQATRFADYLLAKGISSKVLSESDGWSIWIQDEAKIDVAKDELQGFLKDPNDSIYTKAAGVAGDIRRREEKENKRARRNFIDARQLLSRPVAQGAPLTVSLIVLSVAVALLSNFANNKSGLLGYLWIAEITPEGFWTPNRGLSQIFSGQLWRLVTPAIIHLSPIHLLFNMMMMYQLGRFVEVVLGTGKMTALVLAIAVGSNLAEYWFDWQMIPFLLKIDPSPSFGGMSGVVYGLFGFIWLKARHDPLSGFFMPQQTVVILIIWLLLGTVGVLGPIANVAHGMGLAIGSAFGYASAMYHTRWRWH